MGTTLHRGARASHHRGLSCCGAQAPDAQAQWLWLTGPVAPWHVGSSQTRARTRVPCIGRQILNHCATREAQVFFLTVAPRGMRDLSSPTRDRNPRPLQWKHRVSATGLPGKSQNFLPFEGQTRSYCMCRYFVCLFTSGPLGCFHLLDSIFKLFSLYFIFYFFKGI